MENCYYSCDAVQDKTERWSVWRIAIAVVILDKIKLNDIDSMENRYYSCDTGQDKTEHWSVWRIAITVVTLYKIKLNDNDSMENHYNCSFDTEQDKTEWQWQYGESLLQLWSKLDTIKLNADQYGESLLQLWHWTE